MVEHELTGRKYNKQKEYKKQVSMCPFYRIIVKGTFIPVFLAGEWDVVLPASRLGKKRGIRNSELAS